MAVLAIVVTGAGSTLALARFGPSSFPLTRAAQQVFPGASSCPGASGPNTPWREIVKAQLETPLFDDGSGHKLTGAEVRSAILSGMSSTFGASELGETPEEVVRKEIEEADAPDHPSRFVPDGGDAAFAAAACRILDNDAVRRVITLNASTSSAGPTTDFDTGTGVRIAGRTTCESVDEEGVAGETYYEKEEAALAKMRQDPAAAKQDKLRALDASIEAEAKLITTATDSRVRDAVTRSHAMLLRFRAAYSEIDTRDLTAAEAANIELTKAALRFQCPSYLALGYGPSCGRFTGYYQSGHSFTGTVRLRNGRLSCETALAELNRSYVPTSTVTGPPKLICGTPASDRYGRGRAHVTCSQDGAAWDPKDPAGVALVKGQ